MDTCAVDSLIRPRRHNRAFFSAPKIRILHSMAVRSYIYIFWLIFFAGWWIWGVTAKPAKRQQSGASRLAQAAVLAFGFWILASPVLRVGPFGWQILPHSVITDVGAIAFTL